jgi:D-amino-acid dehydrogenase
LETVILNNRSSDNSVIVVGGGVIGIACAHYLSRAGFQVTVIDKDSIASACSYANCGYICPSHVPPLTEPGAIRIALKSLLNPRSPFRVKPSLSPPVLNWMWQFARRCNEKQVRSAGKHLQSILDASMIEYRDLIATHKFKCEWQDKGLLYVFRTEHAFDEFGQTDRMLTEHFGVSANRISSAELPSFDAGLRNDLFGAFHYPGDASLRPDLLNSEWTTYLKQQGVEFIENCELKSVRSEFGKVAGISTSRGELSADRFVFALGALSTKWTKQIGCSIPILPGKGYSVTMARPAQCPSRPMLFPEEKVGVSPFDQGMRLGSMMEFVGYDTSIPAHRIQQLRDAARPYLLASVDGEAQETWYGWRPMTWDSLPIIGPVPEKSNAYLATGHNMLGMSLATSTGRLIAEMMCDEPTHIDATAFSPLRFSAHRELANT